jgi:predicted protein tyrosine phosphatase
LTGRSRNRLKFPEPDEIRAKTLFLFDFHGVEGTSVGIDPYEKVPVGPEIL